MIQTLETIAWGKGGEWLGIYFDIFNIILVGVKLGY